LHSATRVSKKQLGGDNGGNFVKLCKPPCKRELHAFWDGILGESKDPGPAIKVGEKLSEPDSSLAADLSVADWIRDSLQDAENKVYVQPIGLGLGPFTITKEYEDEARQLAQVRIALAG